MLFIFLNFIGVYVQRRIKVLLLLLSSDLLPRYISDGKTDSISGDRAIKPLPVLWPLYSDQVALC